MTPPLYNNFSMSMTGSMSVPPPPLTLQEEWKNINFDEGDPNIIDKNEQNRCLWDCYFIEEGMTEQAFYNKNWEIYEARQSLYEANMRAREQGMYALQDGFKYFQNSCYNQNMKFRSAVSNVVNQMIENGEFENKKEIILNKMQYLNVETVKRVLDLLPPEERSEYDQQYHFQSE